MNLHRQLTISKHMAHSTPSPSESTPAQRSTRTLPDLRALETFMAVCETGSMALAAQRLGVSQSAVSQMIKVQETNYGVKLFDREVRPVRPTRAIPLRRTIRNVSRASARGQPRPDARIHCAASWGRAVDLDQ